MNVQTIALFILCSLGIMSNSFGKTPVVSSGGTQEVQKPLNVTGQTRTLNMLLVLKNKKEKINFIQIRKDYREEILKTNY